MNNRDWAVVVWLTIFIIALLCAKSVRASISGILPDLFSRIILIPLVGMLIYFAVMVFLLCEVGFWDISLLKDTVVWMCSVGILTFFTSTKSLKQERPVWGFIRDNIKMIIFLEFFLNAFVFSLGVELLILPVVSVLMLMQFFAKDVVKNERVYKFTSTIISIFGFTALFYCSYQLYYNWQTFFSIDNLRTFLYPVILSVLFLPFLYFLVLFIHYEDMLVPIKVVFYDEPENYNSFRNVVVQKARFSIRRLKKLRPFIRVNKSMTLDDFKKLVSLHTS